MVKDDGGYIVVETVGTFIPFVLLVASILSLVNIVTLQARMHYALTQAANTLSMYCYVLEVLEVADKLEKLDEQASIVSGEASSMSQNIKDTVGGLGSLSSMGDAAAGAQAAVGKAQEWGKTFTNDPEGTSKLLLNYGLNEVKGQLVEELLRPLVGRYLANNDMSGGEYLTSVRVVRSEKNSIVATGLDALEFHKWGNFGQGNSELINKDGNVKLVVDYEVEYTFGNLPLPFRPTLKITQTAVTKPWRNGSGKGYTEWLAFLKY